MATKLLMSEKKCWICNGKANSREHRIKKSVLKKIYEDVSQQTPIFHRRNNEKKRPIGSLDSKAFQFEPFICNNCNNKRTQKSDRTWEKMSQFILQNWGIIKSNNVINLVDVFGENFEENFLQVQLYFAKILGCKIKESGIDSHLESLSYSIQNESENSNLYISFSHCHNTFSDNYSAISDIRVGRIENREVFMHMFCTFSCFSVDIIYSESVDEIELNGAQLPSEINSFITLKQLDYPHIYGQSKKND
jgi:hypothetical protein